MEQVCMIKLLTIHLPSWVRCGFWSCLSVIQNESEVNLEFISMSFSAFATTYSGMGTRILNL